jgi:hypothetical protein
MALKHLIVKGMFVYLSLRYPRCVKTHTQSIMEDERGRGHYLNAVCYWFSDSNGGINTLIVVFVLSNPPSIHQERHLIV